MDNFWEDLALNLLEKNLNGHSLNSAALQDLFKERPDILEDLDIMDDGEQVEDIDKALYGGRPQIIEIREAKPTEIYHCKACNRSFKRGDNFRRHLESRLHAKRQRAMELAMREKAAPEEEKKETDLKTKVVTNEN
ncbi:MAG: hypothetical protein MK136_17510 [Pirellulaceae bacterium]|nr:hypothetical protein [Pirellulaceae bacterium]